MSNKTIEGGSAFPCDRFGDRGMSLRQFYIGEALKGICSNSFSPLPDYDKAASDAINAADAVMRLLFPEQVEGDTDE